MYVYPFRTTYCHSYCMRLVVVQLPSHAATQYCYVLCSTVIMTHQPTETPLYSSIGNRYASAEENTFRSLSTQPC